MLRASSPSSCIYVLQIVVYVSGQLPCCLTATLKPHFRSGSLAHGRGKDPCSAHLDPFADMTSNLLHNSCIAAEYIAFGGKPDSRSPPVASGVSTRSVFVIPKAVFLGQECINVNGRHSPQHSAFAIP